MSRVILHQAAPESDNVKTLLEVFSCGREPRGEYLYLAEIDEKALKEDGTGDLDIADYVATVEVSFEQDWLFYTRQNVVYATDYPPAPSMDSIAHLTPEQHLEELGEFDGSMLLDSNSYQCSLLTIVRFANNVLFKYLTHYKGRTTQIAVKSRGGDITLAEMHQRFRELVEEYGDIPMRHFTGAISR